MGETGDKIINMNEKIVSFTGKHTIDKMNNIDKPIKIKALRNETLDLNDMYLDYNIQVKMINHLYLTDSCEEEILLKREFEKKINGYKNQDINKEIYDNTLLISLQDVIEKLVASKLKCFYCKKQVLILYKNVRDLNQWTLDRIDNDLCHSNSNTLISCLKCNLQRRSRDMEKFKFTKQLKIKKDD